MTHLMTDRRDELRRKPRSVEKFTPAVALTVTSFLVASAGLASGVENPRMPNNPELAATSVWINPSRYIEFKVKNHGSVAAKAFVVDVYVNGLLKETLSFASIAPGMEEKGVARQTRFTECSSATLRVVVDPNSTSGDYMRKNNELSAVRSVPCADITARIDQDRMNNNLEYKAQIRIVNNGQAPAFAVKSSVVVAAQGTTGGPPIEHCEAAMRDGFAPPHGCYYGGRSVTSLAPGAVVKFTVGPKQLAINRVIVKVTVECADCLETNVANNVVKKTLGPH